jgi:L,D-transpeptidase catalytic domain
MCRSITTHRPVTALGIVVALAAIVAVAGCGVVRRPPAPREPTIADRVAQYGPGARARLRPFFAAAGVPYPPERFVLLGLKHERELHLLAAPPGGHLAFIRSYPIWGASGALGPKLREGDRQVPEGIYTIEYLNPNSVAHLSLGLSYPNAYDLARAEEDGRETETLGGAIMIHGGSSSIGCLAIGDAAAEELFVLAADAGWEDAVVVVSPVDFRRSGLPADYRARTPWVEDLYAWLRAELDRLPLAPASPSQAAAMVGAP